MNKTTVGPLQHQCELLTNVCDILGDLVSSSASQKNNGFKQMLEIQSDIHGCQNGGDLIQIDKVFRAISNTPVCDQEYTNTLNDKITRAMLINNQLQSRLSKAITENSQLHRQRQIGAGAPSPLPEVLEGNGQNRTEPTAAASYQISAGTPIEARHGGGTHWFSGMVESTNADGTYNIEYNDGDKEQGVLVYRVRGNSWSQEKELAVGDRADVHHNGGARVYPAVVGGINEDGTFEIHYDDGDKELSVERADILAAFIPSD
jgi:hypothetical protein